MPRLRIFVSSPGDVAEERLRSVLIVDKLSQDYSRYFEIEGYRWDHEPMLASGHFQDAIDPPSKFDIVVLILWSRLGTALPERTAVREYRGIDDRVPVTGTEWEYENALKAARQSGAPDLLAFRNVSRAPIDPRNPEAQVAQLNALNAFWQRHFVDRGVFLAAYDEYSTLEQFADRLEESLRKLIERRVPALARGEPAGATLWLKEPFRGLQSYDFEHAPIFFGRDGLVTKAIERLAGNARNGAAFLLVSGASGSGKSSVVKAGMAPRLMKPQRIANVGFLRAAVMRPATGGVDLVLGLAQALVADIQSGPAGLPELIGPGQDVHKLADYLRSSAAAPGFAFSSALGRVTEAARREGRLLAHEEANLILVVDQLEEIVTVAGIDDLERQLFITLLGGLARSGSVWIIATLRDDFWARLAQIPELAALSDGNGRLDVAKPSPAELAEMISKPALVAGLAFQPNPDTNITLDRVIAEEAAAAPGVLPLLSFTLGELYKDARSRGSNELSWQHYESLGRLEGAIANRAQAIVDGLSPAAQAALPRVLRALATVGAEGRPVGRTTPLASFADGTPARVLVDAFIAARLLVASSEQGKEVVRLAHEALISRWQKALDQLELDRRYLETRSVVEAQYGRWDKSTGRSKNRLLLRDPDLANAVALASRWGDELDPALRRFVSTSRRRVWLRQGLAAVVTMVFGMIAVAGYFFFRQAEEARKQSEISQLVALAQSGLREGHTREAIEQAAHAFERSPSFETRSALLPALLAVSPHLVGQLDLAKGYAPALAWIGDGALAYATTEGEMRFFDALRRKSSQPLPAARTIVKPRADDQAPLVLALRLVAADRMLAVQQDGSIATFAVRGGEPQLRPPASPIDVRPSPQGAAISRDGSHIVLSTTGGGAHLLACNGPDGAAPSCSDTELAPSANAVEFSPKGDRVALGTEDGKVHVLAVDGAEAMAPLAVGFPVAALAWSPTRDRLAVGGTEGNVVIYDVTNGKLGGAPTRKHPVNAIDWSPSGDRLVFACEPSVLCVARVSENGTVEPTALRFAGHTGAVRKVAFAADGVHIVSSSDSPEILVWSTNPDRSVGFALRSSVAPPVVAAIAYGSADRRLAAAYTTGEVAVWDAANALTRDAATSVEAQTRLKGPAQDAKAIAWRGDGALAVAYQDDKKIAVWPRNLKTEPHVAGFPAAPRQIAFQRNGSRLVALGEDDQIHLVDPARLDDSTVQRRLPWSARAFVVNPIRDQLYASRGGGEIAIWDLAAESSAPSLRVDDPVAALGLAVSPDGRLLAATGGDQFVKIFDLEAARLLARLPLTLATLGQETRGNVAFSSDGGFLAGLGADGRVYIWQRDGTSFALFVIVGSDADAADDPVISPGDYGAALAWLGPSALAIVDKRGSIRVVNLDTDAWQARRRELYFHSP